jgi:hypothetical protein
LETQGSNEAKPGQSFSIQLPENALIDLKSFRLHCDVQASMNNATHFAKLPADFSSLISTMQVFCGGVCISQATSDYNVICRVLKLVKSCRDRDSSIDSLLTNGTMNADDADDDISVCYTPTTGIFDSDSRYLPSMLTGSVTIVIQLATPSVLAFKKNGDGTVLTDPFRDTPTEVAHAEAATFTLKNIHATCDTINMSNGLYEASILDQINRGEDLQIVYKEYHTFRKSSIASDAAEQTFSLSSSSIDCFYSVFQPGNHTSTGIPARAYAGVGNNSDGNTTSSLYFDSCNPDITSTSGVPVRARTKRGKVSFQYFVNNVPQTAFPASSLDAAADLSLINNRLSQKSTGHMITTLHDWNFGKGIYPCVLNMQEVPQYVRTGYDARGSNSSCSVSFNQLLMPTEIASAGIVPSVSLLTIAEVSQVLHIQGGRQLSVEY